MEPHQPRPSLRSRGPWPSTLCRRPGFGPGGCFGAARLIKQIQIRFRATLIHVLTVVLFMHLFMHLHGQGRAPRGEAGWARNASSAAPGGARGQSEPVGLVPRHSQVPGPPIRCHMRGQPVASCSQLPSIKEGGAEASVVDRSLAEKGTRPPSADVSARGLSFSD